MDYIFEGIVQAIGLIFSGDPAIFEVVGLSLRVSGTSVLFAVLIGIPLGILIGTHDFAGKRILLRIIYTLMSLPPVILGLFVFLILMRQGPLGTFQLNYTPTAMIIAQTMLVTPIVIGLTYNIVKDKAKDVERLGKTLGGNGFTNLLLMLQEVRGGLVIALVSAFGRAISEVGAVLIVGGNITDKTRVMTTYIAELRSMGDYSQAIAVGIILLLIALIVNTILYQFQQQSESS
ncbi:MAG: ABC transporter permease [Coriobacteriia bacterium]|nr:ABC transporter permease [Coriobacteriia bacterium]